MLPKLSMIAAGFILAGCGPTPAPKVAETAPEPPKILQFYASPGTVAKGERSLLCYGVEGAASVRLDPAVEELSPSRARCIEVNPAATVTYKLVAVSDAGAEASQAVEVIVDPGKAAPAPAAPRAGTLIQFFTLGGASKVAKGAATMLCYGVKDAASVSLTPAEQSLVPSDRLCFPVRPQTTTNYTLTAISASGVKDTETVRVTVE